MGRCARSDLGSVVFSIFGCIPAMVMPAIWGEFAEIPLGKPILAGYRLRNVRAEAFAAQDCETGRNRSIYSRPQRSQVVASKSAHVFQIEHRSLDSCKTARGHSFAKRFQSLAKEGSTLTYAAILLHSSEANHHPRRTSEAGRFSVFAAVMNSSLSLRSRRMVIVSAIEQLVAVGIGHPELQHSRTLYLYTI
jgi:hypothetical protein